MHHSSAPGPEYRSTTAWLPTVSAKKTRPPCFFKIFLVLTFKQRYDKCISCAHWWYGRWPQSDVLYWVCDQKIFFFKYVSNSRQFNMEKPRSGGMNPLTSSEVGTSYHWIVPSYGLWSCRHPGHIPAARSDWVLVHIGYTPMQTSMFKFRYNYVFTCMVFYFKFEHRRLHGYWICTSTQSERPGGWYM